MKKVPELKTRELTNGRDVDIENQLSWSSGSALMKMQADDSSCQRDFMRTDLAIGILFQHPGSRVTWDLDGKRVLSKVWSPTAVSHDLVVLPPGCTFQSRCQGGGEGIWLFLDPDTIGEDERVRSFAKKMLADCSWSKDRLAWMVASEIRKECRNMFPRGPMFLESAAMTFVSQLAYLLHAPEPTLEPIRALNAAKLRMIVDYIESNFHRNLTLQELSSLVQLTPRYFCSAFKEATGRPPHQFLIEHRIEQAQKLLHDPNLSLINIALCVGFNSQSHLNDFFRRIIGVTPAHYRSELQQKKTSAGLRSSC